MYTHTHTHTHKTDLFLPQHPDNIQLDQLNYPKNGGDERTKFITWWEHPKDDHCLKNSRHENLKSGTHFIVFEVVKVLLNTVWINFKFERGLRDKIQVRPHRKRAAAAGSDLFPRREGVRTLLCKIASSPSNRRLADAADRGHLCFGDRFSRREVRNGGRIHWKNDTRSIEVLRRGGDIRPSVPSPHWFRPSTTLSLFFYNSVLTEEEVLPHRTRTSLITEK